MGIPLIHQMIIIKSKQTDPFSRIPNSILENQELSWKEKGLLSYLLSKPVGFNVTTADIEEKSTDGKSSVYSTINRLIELGYARRYRIRDSAGKVAGWRYDVSDAPVFVTSETQVPSSQELETPDTGNQDVDIQEEDPRASNEEKVISNDITTRTQDEFVMELDDQTPKTKKGRGEKLV